MKSQLRLSAEAAASSYVYIWEFEVVPEKESEFLRFYGPAGAWAELFRQSSGYLGTVLLKDRENSTRYVTIDRWSSVEAHDDFLEKFGSEYEELDHFCESFTAHEACLGTFLESAKQPADLRSPDVPAAGSKEMGQGSADAGFPGN